MILDYYSKLSVECLQESAGHNSELSLISIPISDAGRFGLLHGSKG